MTSKLRFARYASLAALFLCPALISAEVFAADAKYKKKEIEVQSSAANQTVLTKPKEPVKDQKSTGPILSVESFVGKSQDRVDAIIEKQIKYMRGLIENASEDDPQKPDYLFRLGELYSEKQRSNSFKARGFDEKIFQAEQAKKTSEAAQLKQKQQQAEKISEKYALESVKCYVQATKYPKYTRMDEVLFRLAYLLQMIKKEDQARDFFHRLIKDYPQSKYVPNAYLSFAEFYFQKGEMENALKFYEKVEQFPKSTVFGFALYKKGWVEINLGNFKSALEIFVKVIQLCKEGKIDKAQRGPLEKEAKKDLVKAYARTPGATPERAWDFFQRMGDDYAPKMLESLAELYWEMGMFGDSSKVYRKILSLNADSPRICEWQNKILRNTLSGGNKKDQVQELKRLGNVYEILSKKDGVKKDVMSECKNSYHDTGKELALIWHKEAQRTKNADTYQLAALVYREFLGHFDSEKDSPEMMFYFGEILWQTNQWKEAAETYTRVVELDPKGKYVKESAYAAVLAWKNALNIDDSGEGVDKDKGSQKDLSPRPIPEHQKKMIGAFDTYIKYVPDAPELVTIKYRKARIFYEYNHFDEAIKLFQDLVDKHVNHELAIYSANLLLDCLNILKRYKDLLQTVEKFLANPVLMKDQSFREQMVSLKTDSLVAEAKQYEKEKNYKECGISFIAAAETIPNHPKHAERLYNAGLCFQNARLIGQAIKAREQLIKEHEKDILAQRALFQIASGYHQLAYYQEAAKRYEEFANKFPGENKALTALGNAYAFRIGLGEFDQAVKDMLSYVKYYGDKKPQETASVVFQMTEVYEKQNKNEDLVRHLNEYLKKWQAKGGVDKQILAHFKLGELSWKKSCPQDGVNGACLKVDRLAATGRQKVLAEINSKIKDKKKKLKEKARTQCGPPTSSKITVYDRNKGQASDAQKNFQQILKLWDKGAAEKKLQQQLGANSPELGARLAVMKYAVAGAVFYQAEEIYEQFLRVKFPQGLDFQVPTQFDTKRQADAKKKKFDESQKKFIAYLTEKTKLAEKLAGPSADRKGQYDIVLEYKVAHWTIAASARIGQVFADFVNQLYTAEIPKDLKEQDEWGNRPKEIFCDALVDKAEPIESKAVVGYDLCLQAATKESWFNEWSTMCEVELNQLKPADYPLAVEQKPEPGYVSTPITPAAVISELPDDLQVASK